MSDAFTFLATWLLPAILILIIWFSIFRIVTVMEYEYGLVFRFGRFKSILKGGTFLLFRIAQRIQVIDARPVVFEIKGQEVLTSDGINVKVSITTQYQVVNPQLVVIEVQDYRKSMYQVIQVAIREIIGALTIDELIESRTTFSDKLTGMCKDRIAEFGLDLQLIDVKDLMLPADIRAIYSQVIQARKQAMAALERARGESAALRNLANSAKMLDGNPSLLQLRILNAISESGNNTFVIGVGENAGLVPLKNK